MNAVFKPGVLTQFHVFLRTSEKTCRSWYQSFAQDEVLTLVGGLADEEGEYLYKMREQGRFLDGQVCDYVTIVSIAPMFIIGVIEHSRVSR